MVVLESLLLTILFLSCIYFSYFDIKIGKIQNKYILVLSILSIFLDILYYGVYAHPYLYLFLINGLVMAIISILLYALNLWAAGDSKLLIFILLTIPARFYVTKGSIGIAPAIYVIVIAFILAFIYVSLESIVMSFTKKDFKYKIDVSHVISFIKSFFFCSIYLTLVNSILYYIFKMFMATNGILIAIADLLLAAVIYKFDVFKNKVILVLVTIFDLLILYQRDFTFNNYVIYIYLIVLLLLRNYSRKFNYSEIPTVDLKPGMILSTTIIPNFLLSRVKGLPKYSTEDMRSRLTEEEVASIKRWEHSKYGKPTVVIVRKLPFAIFLSLGAIIFILFRMGVII